MKLAYRTLGWGNKLLNTVEKRLQRTTLRSRPVTVDVVLTKACNLACSFCKDYETPTGAKRISIENFENLARQVFPTATRLDICSGGEPYLHGGLTEILRIAKRYGLYTWVLSNGTVCKPDIWARMIDEELISEHGFSVDGFYANTVEGIRLNANLPQILDNIRQLLRLRDEHRKKIPATTIRYALMRTNVEELSDAIRQWGDMGIDRLECGYLSLANGMDPDLSLYHHQDLMHECFEEARKTAEAYPQLTLNLPPTIEEENQRTTLEDCHSPWDFVMVDTNGQIMPCYRAFEAMRFDTVYDSAARPFREIWNSPRYQALRRTVNDESSERFFSYCATCENRCGWGNEKVHLGDATWLESLGTQLVPLNINHQRPVRGTARRDEEVVV